METHHAAFVVAHHGVVAARHPSELSDHKGHIKAVGKRVRASSGRTSELEGNRRGLRLYLVTWRYLVRCR